MTDPLDDLHLRGYQDDTDTSDDATDPVMDEREDDPVKAFGVPAKEFKAELDKLSDGDEEPNQETLAA